VGKDIGQKSTAWSASYREWQIHHYLVYAFHLLFNEILCLVSYQSYSYKELTQADAISERYIQILAACVTNNIKVNSLVG